MRAMDGKTRKVNAASIEGLLRLIQSIPSAKAEPFKQWLAQVGYERIKEIENPELAAKRARDYYKALGYDDAWIEMRLKSIEKIPKKPEATGYGRIMIITSGEGFEKTGFRVYFRVTQSKK